MFGSFKQSRYKEIIFFFGFISSLVWKRIQKIKSTWNWRRIRNCGTESNERTKQKTKRTEMIEMKDHMVRFATILRRPWWLSVYLGGVREFPGGFVPFLKNLGRRRLVDGSGGLLNQIDLRSGHGGGGDEGTVLGADQVQIALGHISAVLGGFQFALEATNLGNALLRALFLEGR